MTMGLGPTRMREHIPIVTNLQDYQRVTRRPFIFVTTIHSANLENWSCSIMSHYFLYNPPPTMSSNIVKTVLLLGSSSLSLAQNMVQVRHREVFSIKHDENRARRNGATRGIFRLIETENDEVFERFTTEYLGSIPPPPPPVGKVSV